MEAFARRKLQTLAFASRKLQTIRKRLKRKNEPTKWKCFFIFPALACLSFIRVYKVNKEQIKNMMLGINHMTNMLAWCVERDYCYCVLPMCSLRAD